MFSIDKIYETLKQYKGEGFSFGLSTGNQIDELLNTPNLWGHDPWICDYTPTAQNLTSAIEELIASAQNSVDISTLYHYANGEFLAAITQGLQRTFASGNRPTVRIIAGGHLPYHTPIDFGKEIETWIGQLNAPAEIPVYVAGMQTEILSMNHAKIVLVDGKRTISGGHNMWSEDYCECAPAHDISVQVSGPAAQVANNFLNEEWSQVAQREKEKKPGHIFPIFTYRKSYMGKITEEYLLKIDNPTPSPAGSTKILALARMGAGLMPDNNPGYNASEFAKLTAICTCTDHIRFTTPWLGGSLGGEFDKNLILELCKKVINQDIQVSIIMSEHGATTTSGDIYYGDSILKTAEQFVFEICQIYPSYPKDLLIQQLNKNLHIAPQRIWPKQLDDPNAKRWMWKDKYGKLYEPANHAKTYIFDEQGFYVGSDNAYAIPTNPLGLQEFGFMFSGQEETENFMEQYWNKAWSYSSQFEFKNWHEIVN